MILTFVSQNLSVYFSIQPVFITKKMDYKVISKSCLLFVNSGCGQFNNVQSSLIFINSSQLVGVVINETSIIVNTLLKLEVHQEDIWVIIFIYRNSSVLSLNESRYSITSLNNTTPLMVDKKFTSEVDLRRGGSRSKLHLS